MSIIQAIILGFIQGLTEFIPVSSSGHLLIAHEVLNTSENSLSFDVALHVGTLLALVLFFRKDIFDLAKNIFSKNKEGSMARLLVYATIPTAVVGLMFSGFIDDNARTPLVVAFALAVAGIIMLIADKYASSSVGKAADKPSTKQGVIIGFAQALALIPGVSRSGATMTAGFFVGLTRTQATRFSFLLAVPVITGSAVGLFIKSNDSLSFDTTLLVGVVTAFISGYLAIKFMLNIIGRVGLKPFAYYRIALAVLVLIFLV